MYTRALSIRYQPPNDTVPEHIYSLLIGRQVVLQYYSDVELTELQAVRALFTAAASR